MKNIPSFEEFLNESNESINESLAVGLAIAFSAAAIGANMALLANKITDNYSISDWKKWWNDKKKDKDLQSIIQKLKNDQEVIEFLQLPQSKQEGKWKTTIAPKLNDEEIKYLNMISKDKIRF